MLRPGIGLQHFFDTDPPHFHVGDFHCRYVLSDNIEYSVVSSDADSFRAELFDCFFRPLCEKIVRGEDEIRFVLFEKSHFIKYQQNKAKYLNNQ